MDLSSHWRGHLLLFDPKERAALFHRSRNLWIPATFHGLGGAFILGASASSL